MKFKFSAEPVTFYFSDTDAASAKLNTVFQAASQDLYNAGAGQPGAGAQGPQPGPQANTQQSNSNNNGGGDVTDVDYEEVK